MFYPSPLGKLDRLTLKLLNSDGTSAKTSFNDTDIAKVNNVSDSNLKVVEGSKFYSNIFKNDRIYNTNKTESTTVKSVTIDSDDSDNTEFVLVTDPETDENLINLSNQLEYIFEVKTQEHDPTSELRPIL